MLAAALLLMTVYIGSPILGAWLIAQIIIEAGSTGTERGVGQVPDPVSEKALQESDTQNQSEDLSEWHNKMAFDIADAVLAADQTISDVTLDLVRDNDTGTHVAIAVVTRDMDDAS